MIHARPPGSSLVRNLLIMPGIDPPGKRFYVAVTGKDMALTSHRRRN
jgi:hypothetical protein